MHAQEQEVDECAQECREMEEEPEPTVKTFSEVLNALDNVKLFLENHGFHQEASSVGDAIYSMCPCKVIKASYSFWLKLVMKFLYSSVIVC